MFRSVVVVVSIAVLAAACGGKSPAPQTASAEQKAEPVAAEPAAAASPAGDFGDRAIAKMQEFKGQVCACQDQACVEEAQKGLTDWAMKHMEDLKEFNPTPEQEAVADRIEQDIDACEARFGGEPSEAPEREMPPQKTASADEIIASMRSFKDQVCKCKDKACVEKVQQDMIEWAMAHMESMKDIKPTKAQEDQANKIEAEMEACEAKIK